MKKSIFKIVMGSMAMLALVACSTKANTETTAEVTTMAEGVGSADASGGLETVVAGKLIMSTNAEFPPYEYREGDKVVGIDADIAQAIADKLGLELVIEDTAFDATILQVASGKADIVLAGMSITEDRKKNVDFSVPYAKTTQVILVTEDSTISSTEDLNAKSLGVQLGTTGDIFAGDVEGATVERYSKGIDAVQAMAQKKIDAVIIDAETAKVFVEEVEGIKILDEPFVEEEYAIAIKKGNTGMVDAVNKALAELKSEGKLDEIIGKYIKAE